MRLATRTSQSSLIGTANARVTSVALPVVRAIHTGSGLHGKACACSPPLSVLRRCWDISQVAPMTVGRRPVNTSLRAFRSGTDKDTPSEDAVGSLDAMEAVLEREAAEEEEEAMQAAPSRAEDDTAAFDVARAERGDGVVGSQGDDGDLTGTGADTAHLLFSAPSAKGGDGGGADGSTDASATGTSALPVGEPTGAPPPARRVRRFFIPGLDEMEVRAEEEDALYYEDDDGAFRPMKQKPTATTADGARHPTKEASPPAVENTHSNAARAASSQTESGASSATHATASKSSPPDVSSVSAEEGSAPNGVEAAHPSSGKAQSGQDGTPPQAATATKSSTTTNSGDSTVSGGIRTVPSIISSLPPSPEKRVSQNETDAYDANDPRVPLPNALVRGMIEKNKHIKKVLMAALGSDFAKAGMFNDGVRTSFSVVSYQTVKQRTGLRRIPAKLLVSCMTSPDKSIDWIDISAHPTATLTEYKEAIQEMLVGLGMHATMVDDSTEPMLLPQVTITKECQSLLMRYALDVQGNKRMDSFQDLTNRFTLFITSERVITVHRTQCTYVEELKKNWQPMLEEHEGSVTRFLLYYFVKETVQTFMRAISKCIVEFDRYEAGLFTATRARASLAREIYHIKRRAAVYGRTLTLTKDAYTHMSTSLNVYPSNVHYQEVLHDLAHMESLAEELNANADSVLQLLFQLSSYQVNELMRVLTLFSAFFIPLSFIAGVYGMNFENLPFLNSEHGEAYCAALMLTVAAVIYFWFKAKHFV